MTKLGYGGIARMKIEGIIMNYEIREQMFNTIMTLVRRSLYFILHLDKHKKYEPHLIDGEYIPLIEYNIEYDRYRFRCYCFDCPCNVNGYCDMEPTKLLQVQLHEFDGDNCIKQWCG